MPDFPQLHMRWKPECTILNLRCDIAAPGVREAVGSVLNLPVPEPFNTTVHNDTLRILWIGPNEWQIITEQLDAATLETKLREALTGHHFAVTDVSSNYQILHLSGEPARDILTNGCPLDLHPNVFKPDTCAGSHYFKAAIWIWQPETGGYELLIRRSFAGYVQLMIEHASAECTLVTD